MTQKRKTRDRTTSITDVTDEISSSTGLSDRSMTGRLIRAIKKEGSVGGGATSGLVTSVLGLVVAGVLPFTILPMLAGFVLGGAVLGKLMPNDVFSVMGGVGIASFMTFLLFVNIPILGLGLISTVLFTLVATGGSVAAYEYFD